ncbi:hypothetical protein JD844_013485 [Phrynosoma platyrhinos]|uniref:acylglycerol lipase n=1 Tax=Phrynosoma platyrhinos TaxID=52577 RepID=A0ABQ7TLQ6_PHRPL|nr:hypothetical protein JD844_013485 [Phrynosoma platyrhinos]
MQTAFLRWKQVMMCSLREMEVMEWTVPLWLWLMMLSLCSCPVEGYLTMSKVVAISHYVGTLMLLLAGIACLRGIGRWTNPQYIQFITILEDAHRYGTPEHKLWSDSRNVPLLRSEPKHRSAVNGFLHAIKKLPCQIASYIVAHTFGRRMLYPGSVYLLQKALMPMLLQGQARLVEEVICCEGNAGFYEVGCLTTPLDAGYSVLGWNHPGFAGSTGVPLPQNEANAMDVVMQYAIHHLGFLPEDIILYACFIAETAYLEAGTDTGIAETQVVLPTWAAMSYPDISALILDASFDDLVPLALKVMPESWRGLVTRTVRQHLNLNNGEQLCRGTFNHHGLLVPATTLAAASPISPSIGLDFGVLTSVTPIPLPQPALSVPMLLPVVFPLSPVLSLVPSQILASPTWAWLSRKRGWLEEPHCEGPAERNLEYEEEADLDLHYCQYQGPVLLVRRTKDEIITTTVPEDIMSNRGNDLLLKLLQHRYPKVMGEEGVRVVREWLEASTPMEETSVYSRYEVEDDWCLSVLKSYEAENGGEFPWSVGEDMTPEGRRQLALFLARKHLQNFEATHCTPLPPQDFHLPWSL